MSAEELASMRERMATQEAFTQMLAEDIKENTKAQKETCSAIILMTERLDTSNQQNAKFFDSVKTTLEDHTDRIVSLEQNRAVSESTRDLKAGWVKVIAAVLAGPSLIGVGYLTYLYWASKLSGNS